MRSIRPLLLTVLTAAALTVGAVSPASAAATTASAVTARVATETSAAAFRLPVAAKTYYLSSHFGPRCIPTQGGSTYHQGVDLAAKAGTPIYAIAAGVVTATVDGTSSRAGYVSVRHSIDGAQYTSTYMHVWSATTQVRVGQTVAAGQRISEVGNSGVSSGSHLHLELWKAGTNGSQAQNAAAFLQQRGIDLYASATAVTAPATPATCTYYTVGAVNFRTGPSTGYSILRTLPSGTAMTHVPGSITAGFIPVTVGSQAGWISASYVSPNKPSAPVTAPAPPPTYATTAPLNLRVSPSISAARILVIPQGANVGVILASSDVWRKVTYAGRTGWVHSAYLVKR